MVNSAEVRQLPGKVKKLNIFIHAKYNTTREQDLIINLSLDHLRNDGNQRCAEMQGYELATALNIADKKNLSRTLKTAAAGLIGNTIIINGPGDDFEIFGIVTNAKYKDGVFSMTYNKKMNPYISDIKSNYTILDRALESTFTSKFSIKVYELLKSEAYKIRETGQVIEVTYNANELKALLSLVNLEKPYIKQALDSGKYSWDDIVEKIARPGDVKYNRPYEIKRYVLDPAMEELNRKSDIHFEYREIKGAHGKVKEVAFRLSKAENFNGEKEISKDIIASLETIASLNNPDEALKRVDEDERIPLSQKMEIKRTIIAYTDIKEYLLDSGITRFEGFTMKYFKNLWEKAGYELKVIKNQIDYGRGTSHIRSYYAWLLKAVENRYSDKEIVEAQEGSTEQAEINNAIHRTIYNVDSVPEGSTVTDEVNRILNDKEEKEKTAAENNAFAVENDKAEENGKIVSKRKTKTDDIMDEADNENMYVTVWEVLKANPKYKNFLDLFDMTDEVFEENMPVDKRVKLFSKYLKQTEE